MQPKEALMFDAFQTLVEYVDFEKVLEGDAKLKEKRRRFHENRAEHADAYMAALDERLGDGRIQTRALPGVKSVLGRLAEQGYALGVYSSSSERSLPIMMEQAELMDVFADRRLLIPVERLGNVPKTDPNAAWALFGYVVGTGYKPEAMVDDELKIIAALAQAKTPIPRLYHLDPKSGLVIPEWRDNHFRIASLDQMSELRGAR